MKEKKTYFNGCKQLNNSGAMKAKLYYKVLRDFGKGKASMLACRSSSLSCVMCPQI